MSQDEVQDIETTAQPADAPAADEQEQVQQEVKEPAKQEIQAIEIDQKGLVKAKDNSELIRYCKAMITSTMVPERFKNPTQLFGALMFVRSVGLPDTAIRQVAVVHGTPSLFGDLPLALVQKSTEMTFFREVWFDKDYKEIKFENKNLDAEVFGAVCFARRGEGTDSDIQSFSFTMKDATDAGLYPPKKKDGSAAPQSPWAKYTKIMLRYRARAIMMKSLFADKMNGIGIGEYDFDETIDSIKDVTPKGQSNLKDTFTEEGETGTSQKENT